MSLCCCVDDRELYPLSGWRHFRTILEAMEKLPSREGVMVYPCIGTKPFPLINMDKMPESVHVMTNLSRAASFEALEAAFGQNPFETVYRTLAAHILHERPDQEAWHQLKQRKTGKELNGALLASQTTYEFYGLYQAGYDALVDLECLACKASLQGLPMEVPYFTCLVIDPLEIIYNPSSTGNYQWSRIAETPIHFHLCHSCIKTLPRLHNSLATDLGFPCKPFKYSALDQAIQEILAETDPAAQTPTTPNTSSTLSIDPNLYKDWVEELGEEAVNAKLTEFSTQTGAEVKVEPFNKHRST